MFVLYHENDIDMLMLGCTLPNLANICIHKSTHTNFYPFTKADKYLLEKNREVVAGDRSIIFTGEAVVGETFIGKSTNICKSLVGIDASQVHPYSVCQAMPTSLYTRWHLNLETNRLTLRQNKTRSFKSMSMSHFQRTRPDCKTDSFHTTGRRNKIDCFSVDAFCSHFSTLFKALGYF